LPYPNVFISTQSETSMTDHPRFELVKGAPDVAHEAYHGGSLVSLVFRLIDGWRGRPRKGLDTFALGHAEGGVEIQERPTALARTAPYSGSANAMTPELVLHRLAPDEGFSGSFLIGSARTRLLQAGLLAAFVAVAVVLVAQGLVPPERPHDQTARGHAPSFKGAVETTLGEDSRGVGPVLAAQEFPALP
jgi:hypothetical protein